MVNLINVAQKYMDDMKANKKKSLREEAEEKAKNAAQVRQNAAQAKMKPNVIKGASVELPTGDTNLVEGIGIDARGKNIDTDTTEFGDIVGNPAQPLIRTEQQIIPEQPEELDAIERIDAALRQAKLEGKDPVEILIQEQMKRGTVKTDGTVDFSREAAYDVVMAEIENAKARNVKTSPDSFSWKRLEPSSVGESLGIKATLSNNNSLATLANNAHYVNLQMQETLPSLLEQNMNKPEIKRLSNLLASYGLINNDGGKITIPEKFGNALTLQLIETFNDEIARKDKFKDHKTQATMERESMLLDSDILLTAKEEKTRKHKYPKFREKFYKEKGRGRDDYKIDYHTVPGGETAFGIDLGRKEFGEIKRTSKGVGKDFLLKEGAIEGREEKAERIRARAEADLRYNMIQMGAAFNPDYTRGTLAKGLLDKLVKNPNQVAEGVVVGQGSAGDTILSDPNKPSDEIGLLSILDQMLWQIAKQQGFLDLIEEVDSLTGLPTESFYMVSPKGEEFFMGTRDIYAKLKKEREDVSKVRPIIGRVIATHERERGDRAISLKAKRDANVAKENRIKDMLGSMPYTVIKDRFNFLEKLVLEKKGGLIILSDDGRPVKLANMPVKTTMKRVPDMERAEKERPTLYNQARAKFDRNKNIELSGADVELEVLSPEEEAALNWEVPYKDDPQETPSGQFYSEHEFASVLGLDYENWIEAFYGGMETAQANGITEEHELQDYGHKQANAVMRDKAREIYRDYQEAQKETDQVYYNKWMHASSVGRFFMRQQVLNAMNSKAVRNIVGSAMPRTFNFNRPMSTVRPHDDVYSESEIFESWRVIIGANLLGPRELQDNQRTSTMNWDAIKDRVDSVFKQGMRKGSTYESWVLKGRRLKEFVSNPNSNLNELKNILKDKSDLKSFQKKSDEWGFKLQSYIDFANYHDAKKNKGTFKALAQTSADGIQSGLTIQALQNGDLDILKLVGLIYNDGNNILPEGDIRQRFWENIGGTSEIAFTHDPDKVSFWNDFINKVNDSDRKETIIKDLAKQPLMETSYGRSIKFNHQAINNFLLHNQDIMQEVLDKNSTMMYNDKDLGLKAMVRDFNHLMGLGLLRTLNFGHQKTISNTGLVWSWMDMNGFYEGPFGTYMFLGSREVVPTGNKIEIVDNSPLLNKSLGVDNSFTIKEMTARPTGSAPSAPGITWDPETGELVKTTQSRYGQEVANQFVVLPTQATDGAIMGNSIDKVNTEATMQYNGGFPLFVFPVHDSITCDCNSIRQYHKTINAELVSLNKEWKQPRAIVNGLLEGLSMKEANLKNDERYMLTSHQSGIEHMHTHRALHSFFLQIYNALKEKDTREISLQGKLQGRMTTLAGDREKLIKQAKSLDWRPEGGLVTGRQLKQLIHLGMKHLKVVSELKAWEKANIYNRKEHLGKINREASNYPIGL